MELDRVPDEFIDNVFTTMALARQHTFQVLTKRPARMAEYMKGLSIDVENWPLPVERGIDRIRLVTLIKSVSDYPLPNIWLGVSAEIQARADERIPLLLETPAAVRFVSAEPLLGPLDLTAWLAKRCECRCCGRTGSWTDGTATSYWCQVCGEENENPYMIPGLDWVIVGGESGGPPERRLVERCPGWGQSQGYPPGLHSLDCCQGTGYRPKPEALAWVRDIRDQCQTAGVPFFLKQLGPRAGQGTLLDGRGHKEMPG